jgi:hypothetical protein
MKRADLHVHSCHSRHASEWILQRLGAQESYTDVEGVYRHAKGHGADFVTLTDHNTIEGALELVSRHPTDCFVSTEATAYFPEDGCKVHVLCYGITPAQFAVIQQARENIYELRDYLRREEIAYSVAHAMYSVNGRLTVRHLEKLLLLFNVFEGINGTRPREGHGSWQELLRRLTPEIMADLADRHQLEPWGAEPWIKGITGGSDDHAGLFIGATYTMARATDIAGFLHTLRAKRTLPGGRYGDHKALAYAIFKVASEYAHHKGGAKGFPALLASILFDKKGPPLRDRLLVKKLGFGRSTHDLMLARFFEALVDVSRSCISPNPAWQVDRTYVALTTLFDSCLTEMARAVEKSVRGEGMADLLQYVTVALPAGLLAAPFFSTLHYFHQSRELNAALHQVCFPALPRPEPRVLWFSDTLSDLNGVSVTLGDVAACAQRLQRPLQLVGCLLPEEQLHLAGRTDIINLPCIYAVTPDFYHALTLRVPSRVYIEQLAEQGLDRQKMKILPRGLDRDFMKLDTAIRERVREQWFAEERPTLLYAGRLGQEKNLDFLLRLFQELRASGQDIRLVLAGDGPARPALERQAAGSPDVLFLGRLDRKTLRACYALADVFVFPSTTDTFGMAVLEAQVCGLPAVVAAAGGPPEIIQHGRSGYALPVDDPAMWTQTLARLLDNRRRHPEEYARWRTEIETAFLPAQDWAVLLDDIMGPCASAGEAAPAEERAPWPHRLYGADVPPVAPPAGQPEGGIRPKARHVSRQSPDLRGRPEPQVLAICNSDASLVNS